MQLFAFTILSICLVHCQILKGFIDTMIMENGILHRQSPIKSLSVNSSFQEKNNKNNCG